MIRSRFAFLSAWLALSCSAAAQQPTPTPPQVSTTIAREGMHRLTLAVPPAIAPITPAFQGQVVDPFHTTLVDDLAGSVPFVVTDATLYPKGMRPPATREQGDAWRETGAQFLVDTQIQPNGDKIVVIAELWDLATLKSILGKKYTSEAKNARRIAHTLANDLVRQFTGKPGPFLTKIVFVSDRDKKGFKEVYLMDFDGENQRRITFHESLSIGPDWSPDGARIVYQSYLKGGPGLYLVARETGEKKQIVVPTTLNASPSFSPDGKTIAYCGSVKGNPEIFTVGLDGTGLKRLTDSAAIDSTPRWAPNGRELAFTSNRQGSPQIYLMDSEGANVRRVTLAGNWNDEASFSPDGTRLAYSCRDEGDFQICVQDLVSGRVVRITTDSGAHENPTWSPDGSKLAYEVTRGPSTQVVVANADGSNPRTMTSAGSNYAPAWSKTLE